MGYTPTEFNEGTAPGISAEELNKFGTQYAEAMTEADNKIAAHAELPTVHQDAPALIAAHTTPNAHHTKYTNAEAIAAAKTDVALLNPSGMIIMWHGTIANIPAGWVICDGNNGTPNLLGKFVEGVATAGTDPGATGGSKSKNTSGHAHAVPSTGGPSATIDVDTDSYYGHGGSSTHTHSIGGTYSENDSISDIRPPYYDIAFIMKT